MAKKKAKAKKNAVGHPLKFPNLEKLQQQIDEYFAFCNPHIEMVDTPVLLKNGTYDIRKIPTPTRQIPYTISGLAYWLETNRTTLLDYEHLAEKEPDKIPLHLRDKDPFILRGYTDTIKKAKARVEGFVEMKLMQGGHPAGPIFNLKNNFQRWEDKTVVDNPAEAQYHKSIEELRDHVFGRVDKVKTKKHAK